MKICASAFVFFTIFTSLQSQTNSKHSVSMYFSTFPSEKEGYFVIGSTGYGYPEAPFSHAVSFAYQWNHTGKFINEIEIMPLRHYHIDCYKLVFDSSVMDYYSTGHNNQFYNSSARYSYSYLTGFKRINLIVGCASRLFYDHQRIKPYTSHEFFRSATSVGIMLEFLSGLQYALAENIDIRLDVPLSLMDFEFRRMKNENPHLPKRYQISDQIGAYLLSQTFQFRIGMSYKIGSSLE